MSSPSIPTFTHLIAATGGNSGVPTGWRPLAVDNSSGEQKGLIAQAYKNDATGQIVITFIGPTSAPYIPFLPTATAAASAVNLQILNGQVPTEYQNAATRFLQQVTETAAAEGFSVNSSNTFVAGNSLGGYGAQYLASQNGFGGASFGGPGVLNIAPNPTQNFTSYVIKGDAVANAASDTGINWTGVSQFGSHYGSLVMLGSQANQDKLAANVQTLSDLKANPQLDPEGGVFLATSGMIAYQTKLLHNFTYYQEALGIDPGPLPPPSPNPPVPDVFYAPWGHINAPGTWTLDSDGNEILKVNGTPVLTIPQDAEVDYADATHKALKISDPVEGGGTIESTLAFTTKNAALVAWVTSTDVSNRFDWSREVTAIHPDFIDKIVVNDNNTVTSATYAGAEIAGNIGALFGSKLGNYLGGDQPFAKLAAGTVLGAIGKEVGKALFLGGSFTLETSIQNAFGTLAGEPGVGSLPSAAIATISSLLMSELADTLNLSGFEGGLFTTVGTTITTKLITNAHLIMTNATWGNGNAYTMFTGFNSDVIVPEIGSAVGGYLGSTLAGHIVIPHYAEGVIGQQVGSAVGGMLGTAIVPVIGGFVGCIARRRQRKSSQRPTSFLQQAATKGEPRGRSIFAMGRRKNGTGVRRMPVAAAERVPFSRQKCGAKLRLS
jgi:uncharacterized protein YcfJ